MKWLLPAALCAVFFAPAAVRAQQSDQTGPATAQTSAPSQSSTPAPGAWIYRRWSEFLSGLNLSDQQHDQIQSLLDKYAQAHPYGSMHDPKPGRELRRQIFAVLTPDQQTQVRQKIEAWQAQRRQARMQRMQQQQQTLQPSGEAAPTPTP